MVAHHYPVQGFRRQAYQVTMSFIVVAAAMLNASQLATFIVLIHLAEQGRLRRRLDIQWFNLCNYFLSAAMAAAFYHRATALLPNGALGQVAAALSAGCTFVLLNPIQLPRVLSLSRALPPPPPPPFHPEFPPAP